MLASRVPQLQPRSWSRTEVAAPPGQSVGYQASKQIMLRHQRSGRMARTSWRAREQKYSNWTRLFRKCFTCRDKDQAGLVGCWADLPRRIASLLSSVSCAHKSSLARVLGEEDYRKGKKFVILRSMIRFPFDRTPFAQRP